MCIVEQIKYFFEEVLFFSGGLPAKSSWSLGEMSMVFIYDDLKLEVMSGWMWDDFSFTMDVLFSIHWSSGSPHNSFLLGFVFRLLSIMILFFSD